MDVKAEQEGEKKKKRRETQRMKVKELVMGIIDVHVMCGGHKID